MRRGCERWDCTPGEGKAQEDLIHQYKYLMEGTRKMELGFSLWFPLTGQEAMDTT